MTKAELVAEIKRLKRQIARNRKLDEKASIVVRGGTVIIPDRQKLHTLSVFGGMVCARDKLKVKVSGEKP